MKKIPTLLIALFLIYLAGCGDGDHQEEKTESRPNFLFLFADDQTYASINSLNNAEVKTPNLDRLAAEGVVFTHCFNQGSWGGAVCIASRAMLISGQYMFAAREGVNHNQLWGETFTKAGYETFFTGKWHNKDATVLKSFKYAKSIGKGMYETMHPEHKWKPGYGRPTAENNSWNAWDPIFTGHWTPKVKDIVYDENGNKHIGPDYRVEQHTSELYADNAISFLQNQGKNSDDPFFMYVSFNAPHDPRQSPKSYVDMYPPENIEVPENFVPEHPFDQGDHKLRDENLAPFPRTENQVQVHRSEYYAIITHMDHEIGRILKALEQSGKADNTYIIFSADHGLAVGHHGLLGKQNQYDHSVRMPFIISGPGLERGVRKDALMYLQSIYPTTCELAGLAIPETVDFPSLKPVLEGKEEKVHDAIFGNYRHFQRMVRTDKHKLIVYPHNGHQQLFDLEKDPEEMVNLIDDKAYDEVKNELYTKLLTLQKEVGDTLRVSLN
ncbi:sulfatase-like hydrolase/transferase [Fulvivirgaceae bacterium BMA12]|uniref:Sulfatase-like hydrolase/transferase n=1 Tax=Agaribacillus aureus TaxID=3051825 RepID=A0ABT8LGC9_9BACT|nr:sulfatase-like hydrolase/transferase [Fulvivirgaceae bacterium BMA12]